MWSGCRCLWWNVFGVLLLRFSLWWEDVDVEFRHKAPAPEDVRECCNGVEITDVRRVAGITFPLTLLIMLADKGYFVARNNTIVGLFFWQLRSGDVSGQWTSETRLPVPNSGPGAGVRCRWAVSLPVRSLLTPVQVWGKKPASFFPPFWLIWSAAGCIWNGRVADL